MQIYDVRKSFYGLFYARKGQIADFFSVLFRGGEAAGNQLRVLLAILTNINITGTSTSTPTTVANAAPDNNNNNLD